MPEKRMAAIAIAFGSGILVAEYSSAITCAIIAAAALIAGLIVLPSNWRPAVFILAVVFVLGSIRYMTCRSIPRNDISRFTNSISSFEGTITSDPDTAADHVRFALRSERACIYGRWVRADGSVMISLYQADGETPSSLQYGDRIRVMAPPYSPSEPTNPGQFSWKDYLARQGIYACAYIRSPSQISLLENQSGNLLVRTALRIKHYLIAAISKIHPKKEASVMAGIVLGTYAYLEPNVMDDFSRTGTLHILAASGYNCFIILLFATPILRLIHMRPKWISFIVMALICIYVMMVGPKPSLVRASIMASLALLATPFRRVPDYKNLFFVAAFISLAIRPSDLFDVGFQLSFLAVWALISVTPVIEMIFQRTALAELAWKKRPQTRGGFIIRTMRMIRYKTTAGLASAAISTIAISLVTGPLIAYYFNYISLTSIPANMAAAIIVPFVFFDSLISAITALIPHAQSFIGFVGTYSTRAMLIVLKYFGSMQYSAISIGSPSIVALLGYYLVLYAGVSFGRSKLSGG